MFGTNNIEKDVIREEWKNFLIGIEQFISQNKSAENLQSIIDKGLEVFLQASDTVSASLYILNEESFEFEHRISFPEDFKEISEQHLSTLIEQGALGFAMQSGSVVLNTSEQGDTKSYHTMIVPLIISWGVFGIVLVLFDTPQLNFGLMFQKICSLFGTIYGGAIENILLFKNLNQSKEFLEQEVASRTMSLAQSKREMDAIFDSVLTGILVIDAESNKIVKANPLSAEIIGEPEDYLIGIRYYNYLDFNEIHHSSSESNIFFKKNFESELKRSDGQIIPILRTITIISVGNSRYRIESFNDISDIKKAEIALKEANTQLELKVQERTVDLQNIVEKLQLEVIERNKAEQEVRKMLEKEIELNEFKTNFVTMVSHEFRTPLTVIRSSAQMMEQYQDKLTSEEKVEYLLKIINTVDYMQDLIENVIFIGRSDTERPKLVITQINLKDLCTSIINEIQLTSAHKRIININIDAASENINSDSKVLRLIIINLLINAIKYSNDGKPVDIDIKYKDSQAIICVKDYGIGIPELDHEKIFDVFYRGKNVGSVAGTGLGLSVAINSAQLLSGKLDFTSKVNEGSTFRLTIPSLIQKD
ncbi:MAG: hypothetical protein HW421_342 [Ignavibacteria bacterium]|nr:hypothetical protein [Ignavibacteria bacterium]